MENRFLEMDDYLKQISAKKGRCGNGRSGNASGGYAGAGAGIASFQSSIWSQPFSATDRVLVILIENGGVDLGIPDLVDKLLSLIPGASMLPDSIRQQLIDFLRKKIQSFTDNLLETVELSANRYDAAKPNLFGDVVILRDGTASYQDLKGKLLALSGTGKIVDLFILTHGSDDFISVPGGINSQKIKDMKAANGKPLSIRSVYMMNCVGSSLNQAWIDVGAKVSSGALRNNYLPEPTMFFFWKNWQEGQTFENAITSAYRKTINLMNDAISAFLNALPFPASSVAGALDFENLDFVKDSAPVIQGQRSITINSDNLSFSQSTSSSLATTVLPVGLLRSLGVSQSADARAEVRAQSFGRRTLRTPRRAVAMVVPAAVPIVSAIVGATMTRILNNEGDISWELDQLQGLKHVDNNAETAGSALYQDKAITINGPHAWLGGGLDHIYVDTEIAFQHNGHSLGNVQVTVVRSNDAVGVGLVVKANIMDDANAYTKPPGTERFAAIKLRIHYRFTFSIGGDYIYIDDIVIYADGTYARSLRKTQ